MHEPLLDFFKLLGDCYDHILCKQIQLSDLDCSELDHSLQHLMQQLAVYIDGLYM